MIKSLYIGIAISIDNLRSWHDKLTGPTFTGIQMPPPIIQK
jgi:hypothetical protein